MSCIWRIVGRKKACSNKDFPGVRKSETSPCDANAPPEHAPAPRNEFSSPPTNNAQNASLVTRNEFSSPLTINAHNASPVSFAEALEAAVLFLQSRDEDDAALTDAELQVALRTYHELRRVLSQRHLSNDRKPDWTASSSKFRPPETAFREQYEALVAEFDEADDAVQKAMMHPAAVRPLALRTLQEETCGNGGSNEFFILDNSLRETTVGASRGHTLEEKHKIIRAMHKTGLEEVILGAFGSKISVDSQIAEQWRDLGRSFDRTWGFSDCFDMEPYDEDRFWEADSSYASMKASQTVYYTPDQIPKQTYSKDDMKLLKRAAAGFQKGAFGGKKLKTILKESESKKGRIPLGLIMMAGYGIKNACIEIDTSLETFDYAKHDVVSRCQTLIKWIKKYFPRRDDVAKSGDNTARVLVNLRDFSNYHRSAGGTEEALRLVDSLSRLPRNERCFGFMMEEPTGWLFPDQVGRLCRMIRVTMDRAGFSEGRFLVHVHWYFGLAEASQLTALCNGADGVWAAVCKAGAQTGHACSTMTAVNLYRAGNSSICDQYNLEKMCEAARAVTEISTRAPCPKTEEIYGELAFDIPYFMIALPSCRYSIFHVLTKIGVKDRMVRLNELSMVTHVEKAMEYYFGPPDVAGWDRSHCKKMQEALHNHLLTGLSRDYNSPLGLGHLYSLVSREKLSFTMIEIMAKQCPVSDYHPVVLDFVYRWNRLCRFYESSGGEVEAHPAAYSKSFLFWGVPAETQPIRETLPFEFFTADVMRNPVLEPVPRLFKLQVVNLLTADEQKIQGKSIPIISFYETVLRLKLFIQEADSLRVLGLVDDFCIRKNHDFFFGQDSLWLQEINSDRPGVAKRILLNQMKFYNKYYINSGNTAIARCIESTAVRIDENRAVPLDMQEVFRRGSAVPLVHKIADRAREQSSGLASNAEIDELNQAHEAMLRSLAEDEGQDEDLAQSYLENNRESLLGLSDSSGSEKDGEEDQETLAEAYIRERRRSISSWRGTDVSSSGRRGSVSLNLILRGSAAMKESRRESKMIDPLGIHESIRESLLIDSIAEDDSFENGRPK